MKKILLCAGARPNFPKLAALWRALDGRATRVWLHTGQHHSDSMSAQMLDDLELPEPNIVLRAPGSGAQRLAEIIYRSAEAFDAAQPDTVVVVGDCDSTLACAIAAKKAGFPLAHVEAGLRCGDSAMQEEINRKAVDSVSDFLFASEPAAMANLRAEGLESSAHYVGNVMVDTLLRMLPKARALTPSPCPNGYALLTLHRAENVDSREKLAGIIDALGRVDTNFIFPVHPRTRKNLGPLSENITAIEPLGYLRFVQFMDNARFIMTDSGGVQEEAVTLGKPCLTLRDSTERPSTLAAGNRLVGTDSERIEYEASMCAAGAWYGGRVPSLWDGHAAERIAEILV